MEPSWRSTPRVLLWYRLHWVRSYPPVDVWTTRKAAQGQALRFSVLIFNCVAITCLAKPLQEKKRLWSSWQEFAERWSSSPLKPFERRVRPLALGGELGGPKKAAYAPSSEWHPNVLNEGFFIWNEIECFCVKICRWGSDQTSSYCPRNNWIQVVLVVAEMWTFLVHCLMVWYFGRAVLRLWSFDFTTLAAQYEGELQWIQISMSFVKW